MNDANGEDGPAERIRRALHVRDHLQARLNLQFEQSDRLDRRLGTSLGFSGGLVALFGVSLLLAFNAGSPGESVDTSFENGVFAAAMLFLANALTAGCALAFLSNLSPGAEVGDFLDQEVLAESEEELIWWEINAIRSAIERNRLLLRRKAGLVALSLALTAGTAATIAIPIAVAALS